MDLLSVKGITNKNIPLLNKLGINNYEDLITYYPYRFDILKETTLFDEKVVVDAVLMTDPVVNRFRGNFNRMTFTAQTHGKNIKVVIFNRYFLKTYLEVGKTITIIGKYDKEKNLLTASDIKLEPLNNKTRIIPVYHLTTDINNKKISTLINNALSLNYEVKDYIPNNYVDKYHFINKNDAVKNMHMPKDTNILTNAVIRTKYEELFLFLLKINYLKMNQSKEIQNYQRKFSMETLEKFVKNLPFELTPDQKDAMFDIIADLASPRRMNRLLQGDVGSGKTVVAVIAIYAIYLAKMQSALMVPTEILARQHFDSIKALCKNSKINIALLLGSTPKKEKDLIARDLATGKIDLVIGTHALISEKINYYKLGLVITDEQHRFGVNQRNSLKNKGLLPDVLYMSATPIPRTLALTIYGDMDISNIKTVPKGRLPIKTYLKKSSELKDVLTLIKKEILDGHQVYVIAPLIEENEEVRGQDVNKLAAGFNRAFGTMAKVAILHGKMKAEAKEKIMHDFEANKINILISTTVVEVGVNIPNATIMVIFDADYFGLATLHQLRGRVGRSNLQSYCFLVSNTEAERLKVMERETDGFKISEADFELRGQGDLFGTSQSGDTRFKIASLERDFKLLLHAKEDVLEFMKQKDWYTSDYEKILNESTNMD